MREEDEEEEEERERERGGIEKRELTSSGAFRQFPSSISKLNPMWGHTLW